MDKLAFLKNKWVIAVAGFILIVLIVLTVFLSSKKTPAVPSDTSTGGLSFPSPASNTDLRKAPPSQEKIAQQMNADEGYAEWELQKNAAYPWINRIPIQTEKYFVYFDLNQKIFIGYLYPTSGDSITTLKTEAQRVLKEVKGIPIESYKFTWIVNRK